MKLIYCKKCMTVLMSPDGKMPEHVALGKADDAYPGDTDTYILVQTGAKCHSTEDDVGLVVSVPCCGPKKALVEGAKALKHIGNNYLKDNLTYEAELRYEWARELYGIAEIEDPDL